MTLPTSFTISDDEFTALRELIHQRFGIHLGDGKKALVIGRLQKILRQGGFSGFSDYYRFVVEETSGQGLSDLVNAISTNHTYFFREADHFTIFSQEVLPRCLERHAQDRDLRIWCAGCSSGEEAYVLAMLILEGLGRDHARWNAGLLATDISQKALAVAEAGIYPDERVQQIPAPLRTRYWQRLDDERWQASEALRREITFRRFNLMNDRFPFRKPFDVIFCRNVMIYFDQDTRQRLVQRFHDHTTSGGHLFISHSESLGRDRCPYRYLRPAMYIKD